MSKKPIMGIYRAPEKESWLNHGERPAGTIIDTIVLHYTVTGYKESYNILTAERGVSAHYLVREDGRIDNLVADEKKAWHAGISIWHGQNSVNNYAIGIEIVNPGSGDQECFPIDKLPPICEKHIFPRQQLDAVVELIAYLRNIYPDIKNNQIIGHADITAYEGRKIDPGVAFDWQYLANNGHGIYSNKTIENRQVLYSIGNHGDEIKVLQSKLSTLGYNVTIDGNYDNYFANVVRAFNLHFNQETGLGWGSWDNLADLRLNDLLGYTGEVAYTHDEL